MKTSEKIRVIHNHIDPDGKRVLELGHKRYFMEDLADEVEELEDLLVELISSLPDPPVLPILTNNDATVFDDFRNIKKRTRIDLSRFLKGGRMK